MAVVLAVTWKVKEGSEDVVLEALAELAPRSREEPGCSFYQAYRDPAEPRLIRLLEIYDDEDALAAHGASRHFQEHAIGKAFPALESRERELFETIDL